MTFEEASEITKATAEIDAKALDAADQIKMLEAFIAYAEAVKPIVEKYVYESPLSSTFLMRL